MKYRFSKEQCEAFLEVLRNYAIRPGTSINGHDMGEHYRNVKSYLDAQTLIQEQGLETCPVCNLDPMRIPGLNVCKHCGMEGQMPWGG